MYVISKTNRKGAKNGKSLNHFGSVELMGRS
jgi:hypothetical protein